MATDWTPIRLEYINGSMTLRELADKHGINAAGVMARSAKELWEDQRKQKSAEVSRLSQEQFTDDRASVLAKFNEDDLRIARAVRAKAAQFIKVAESPSELAQIARALDTAQKVGRLALGATTENTAVTTRTLEPLPDDAFIG